MEKFLLSFSFHPLREHFYDFRKNKSRWNIKAASEMNEICSGGWTRWGRNILHDNSILSACRRRKQKNISIKQRWQATRAILPAVAVCLRDSNDNSANTPQSVRYWLKKRHRRGAQKGRKTLQIITALHCQSDMKTHKTILCQCFQSHGSVFLHFMTRKKVSTWFPAWQCS